MNAMLVPPPLSLYVHLPWCLKKCPYCDFNSHAPGGALPFDAYVDALLADLEFECAGLDALPPVQSIFFGGGTPSLFPPAAIARLLDGVKARLALVDDIEISLEANPGAHQSLPPDPRAEHAVCRPTACRSARRRPRLADAGRGPGAARGRRLRAV